MFFRQEPVWRQPGNNADMTRQQECIEFDKGIRSQGFQRGGHRFVKIQYQEILQSLDLASRMTEAVAGAVVSKPTAISTTVRSLQVLARERAWSAEVTTLTSIPLDLSSRSDDPLPGTLIMSPYVATVIPSILASETAASISA